jgi:hypothetical protein
MAKSPPDDADGNDPKIASPRLRALLEKRRSAEVARTYFLSA